MIANFYTTTGSDSGFALALADDPPLHARPHESADLDVQRDPDRFMDRRGSSVAGNDGSRQSDFGASQLPTSAWHEYLGGGIVAGGICDRFFHNAHRIDLQAKESLR